MVKLSEFANHSFAEQPITIVLKTGEVISGLYQGYEYESDNDVEDAIDILVDGRIGTSTYFSQIKSYEWK